MGYDIFRFGALCLDRKIQPVPLCPKDGGDIPQYDGKAAISLETSVPGKNITWIKPYGSNILVADHVLLVNVSWEDLDKNGFVVGKTVLLDRQRFRCRLLRVGENEDVPNEWDKILDVTSENNAFWHWKDVYFWGVDVADDDVAVDDVSYRAVRGWSSARFWDYCHATSKDVGVGFRPAIEPLSSDTPIPNINLDGADFQLSSLPGGEAFCPILQPTQGNVFKDIPAGGKVRMYTFMENGCPIHMDEPVKDPAKLTLTDRYFGDEYLISWVISNGVAVASKS